MEVTSIINSISIITLGCVIIVNIKRFYKIYKEVNEKIDDLNDKYDRLDDKLYDNLHHISSCIVYKGDYDKLIEYLGIEKVETPPSIKYIKVKK